MLFGCVNRSYLAPVSWSDYKMATSANLVENLPCMFFVSSRHHCTAVQEDKGREINGKPISTLICMDHVFKLTENTSP
jgi:hypothetical protein